MLIFKTIVNKWSIIPKYTWISRWINAAYREKSIQCRNRSQPNAWGSHRKEWKCNMNEKLKNNWEFGNKITINQKITAKSVTNLPVHTAGKVAGI